MPARPYACAEGTSNSACGGDGGGDGDGDGDGGGDLHDPAQATNNSGGILVNMVTLQNS